MEVIQTRLSQSSKDVLSRQKEEWLSSIFFKVLFQVAALVSELSFYKSRFKTGQQYSELWSNLGQYEKEWWGAGLLVSDSV